MRGKQPTNEDTAPAQAVIRNRWPDPWLAGIILAALLLCLPFHDTVLSMDDEGVLANGASRMLSGQTIYRDFFEFLPPAGFFITEGWFWLFGDKLASLRALGIMTTMAAAGFIFVGTRRASGNAPIAALMTLGWLFTFDGAWAMVGHHGQSTLAAAIMVWAAVRGTAAGAGPVWPVVSGMAAGAAAMITPNLGAPAMLAGLVSTVLARQPKDIMLYVAACAIVPIACLLYILLTGSLSGAIADVIVYPLSRYAGTQSVPFGHWAGPTDKALLCAYPGTAILAVVTLVPRVREGMGKRLRWTGLTFAFAGFVAIFPRPDIFHIHDTVPLAFPFLASCLAAFGLGRPVLSAVIQAALVLTCLTPAAGYLFMARTMTQAAIVETPKGPAKVIGFPGAPAIIEHIRKLPDGTTVFYYPFEPMMAFLMGRPNVSPVDWIIPGNSTADQIAATCRAVVRSAGLIVIDRHAADPAVLKAILPAQRDPHPPAIAAFEHILDEAFTPEARYGDWELRRRRADADAAVCANIPLD